MFLLLSGVCIALLLTSGSALGLTVDDLDPTQEWRVDKIEIDGNQAFSDSALLDALLTKERPGYLPWQERPRFDPVTFTTDLERLQRFYEAHGRYGTQVTYELQVDERAEPHVCCLFHS